MVSTCKNLKRWLIVSLAFNSALLAVAAGLIAGPGSWRQWLHLPGAKAPRFAETKLYRGRLDVWSSMPATSDKWIFLGDSLMDYAPTLELFGERVLNRGIAGDRVSDISARLPEILRHKPRGVVLWAGVNDLLAGMPCSNVVTDLVMLASDLKSGIAGSEIVLIGPLPGNSHLSKDSARLNEGIRCVNSTLAQLAEMGQKSGFQYLNPADLLANPQGELDDAYTFDGIHLSGSGYDIWARWLSAKLVW